MRVEDGERHYICRGLRRRGVIHRGDPPHVEPQKYVRRHGHAGFGTMLCGNAESGGESGRHRHGFMHGEKGPNARKVAYSHVRVGKESNAGEERDGREVLVGLRGLERQRGQTTLIEHIIETFAPARTRPLCPIPIGRVKGCFYRGSVGEVGRGKSPRGGGGVGWDTHVTRQSG